MCMKIAVILTMAVSDIAPFALKYGITITSVQLMCTQWLENTHNAL